MLPQLLSVTAGRDAWMSALLGTVLELGVLFIALTALTLNKDKDIYSALRSKTTWVGAKVIITGMLFIFIVQLFILISQAYYLLSDNMFEHVNVYYFAIPMLLLGIFFCFLPARAIFRSGEIFFVFIIIGVALSVFPAITQINAKEVLPMFYNGAAPVFNSFYLNIIFFESAFLLLMFSGDIKIEKHFRKKFMTTATFVGLFFVFFVFMFYALFGPLAPMRDLAISNLTIYSSYITENGRIDWVLVTIWLLLLLLRFGITFYCAFMCLRYLTHVKHRASFLAIPLALVVYFLSVFVFTSQRHLNSFIHAVPWLIVVLYIIIPVIILISSLLVYKKKGAKRHV